jgi:hypothetical protein
MPAMDRPVCYSVVCTSGSKHLEVAETVLMMQTHDTFPHPPTNKTREGAQAIILENRQATTAEI